MQNIYELDSPQETMQAFHKLGNKTLTDLLVYYSSPLDKKSLRTWNIRDASKLVGRTEQYIRKLEKKDNLLGEPLRNENGRRYYTLERINYIREKLSTMYIRPQNSSPIILAISNFKGGVAKSTTTLHLAQKCAINGLKVLCLDLDPQATLSLGFGFIPDVHLEESDTINSALLDSPDYIKKVIKSTYFPKIDIIAGNLSLSNAELQLADIQLQKKSIKTLGVPHKRLQRALELVKDSYDVICLDCGPNLGSLTLNAVIAANSMLVPIPPMMPDFASYVTFTGTLAEIFSNFEKKFDFFRILLTKNSRSQEARGVETLMRERFGRLMLTNSILTSVEIEKASSRFGSVYEIPKNSGEAYRRALETLDNVNDEIIEAFKNIWDIQSKAQK